MTHEGQDRRDKEHRRADYHVARQAVAGVLAAVVVLMLTVDAVSVDHGNDVSPVVLAALLGTIAALVGVELKGLGR